MSGDTSGAASDCNPIALSADIVSAYVSKNVLPARELPGLIVSVHAAFAGLSRTPAALDVADLDIEKPTVAQIRKSITPEGLISFIDGKSYKTLKRHLRRHGLDADSYRARYGLPSDYPTTAPNYSAQRSAMAKGYGLGQRRAD
ncbi:MULTISPECIES: MucR family transcriptional regulator [Methylorubrum]|uniref:MucR family transcriptional regulator n=1 Tax=Methylorubrum TaxID=2282523 RepID=UPI0021850C7A|nr:MULTISPECIES: MucR family transcriptional regulator [Methylorubrum]UYW32498.1 MucR family transcriptional regulator [Methylorubrum extorquens]BDL40943.1 transcriptional regulator [Methylorubrum sp. GM97]